LLFSYTVHTIIGESGRCIFSWFCFAASDIVKWGDVKKLSKVNFSLAGATTGGTEGYKTNPV